MTPGYTTLPEPPRALRPPLLAGEPATAALLAETARRLSSLVTGHSTGQLRAAALHHLARPGKMLRARLALEIGGAFGQPPSRLVPWAAACELLHNAALVHDDIQDRGPLRRGRPSVWARFSEAEAINVGDLLLMLPALALDDSDYGPAVCWRLSRLLAEGAALTVDGQSREQRPPGDADFVWAAYDTTALGKTGQLFALPAIGAAVVAGQSEATARDLGDVFAGIGLLFQMANDLDDLSGNAADLLAGRVNAAFVAHVERLRRVGTDPRPFLGFLRECSAGAGAPEIDALRAILDSTDARRCVSRRIRAGWQSLRRRPVIALHPPLAAVADALVHLFVDPPGPPAPPPRTPAAFAAVPAELAELAPLP